MRYKYTWMLTLFSVALCFIHFIGHETDPVYLLFYALSVPAWFYPLFQYTNINPVPLYLLTILSWAIIGYCIDRLSVHRRTRTET
ncbi:hypothetical protein O9H85_34810 [Paenibacillus filicis]|uniref:DUF3311 domain-containing protein n=1 Tax=Paenibacillus gyeongsangnamensis TaxID=3388067 RepID=A0ABT4QKM4_9BACL|nr:hypothetical protein [Paenibacillus filicis]MCZ8517429.1 hypothetical protein [Paenibacillus filicis]